MGFKDAKAKILSALANGTYQHEARGNIDEKNKLAVGEVTADEVREIIKKCRGGDHTHSPHHMDSSLTVHVLRKSGWYIKFYFIDPDALFISVHK